MQQKTEVQTPNLPAILERIFKIGAPRPQSGLKRRMFKCGEELGEVTEAHLAITSGNNYKNLTIADVREEAVDVLIVAIDVFFTWRMNQPIRGEAGFEAICQELLPEFQPMQQGICDKSTAFEYYLARCYSAHGRMFDALTSSWNSPVLTSHPFDEPFKLVTQAGNLAWTRIPGDDELTDEEHLVLVCAEIDRKLSKWERIRSQSVHVLECKPSLASSH